MGFWDGKRVTVTGGGGFLGSHIVDRLKALGCREIFVPRRAEYDLREKEAVIRMYEKGRPDILIHAAASVGGIGANKKNPGAFFFNNAIMGLQVIEAARQFKLKKLILIGTACSYPKHTPVPFKEEDLWNGYPEETNAPYGLAKKMLIAQIQAYREQYKDFNGISVIPVNLYGPRDNFDPEMSHVIPGMIQKSLEALERGEKKVIHWGTGTPTREFLYGEDAAEGILLAAERYEGSEPVNLGSGEEISIQALADQVAQAVGFRGTIGWNFPSHPEDGQPKRRLDTSRAKSAFGFCAKTPFDEGLRRTITWYRQQRAARQAASR